MTQAITKDPIPRQVWVLLGLIVVSGITTFMYMPILAIYLVDEQYTGVVVGVSMGVLGAAGQLSSVIIGALISRLGARSVAVSGVAGRCLGLYLFTQLDAGITPVLPAFLTGLGGTCLSLALKTHLMSLAPSRRLLALRSAAINIGAIAGPGIGGALYLVADFDAILILGVGTHIVMFLVLVTMRSQNAPLGSAAKSAVDRFPRMHPHFGYIVLFALVFAYWAIYSQWSLLLPLAADAAFHSASASSIAFSANAVIILALQYIVLVKALGNRTVMSIAAAGFAAMTLAYCVLAAPTGAAGIVAYVLFFTLGEMLISPSLDELGLLLVGPGRRLGGLLGWTGMISGVATLVGSWLTGVLLGDGTFPAVLFGRALAAFGLGVAGIGSRLQKGMRDEQPVCL